MKDTNTEDKKYMQRAIELAKKGKGWVNPNPQVGAVIVKDGRIIGEGWHTCYGKLHAEREAFASLKESAEGATIYVTLEPCCHHGKQPPCTDAILQHGIARVVIGSRDPNPLVAGKGAQILRNAGVKVEEDFMREECDKLNPVFFHYITAKTPYVVMKYAMTADGKIACYTGDSKWVTGEESRARVQEMRSEYFGIMAGIGTVLADDPMLNCRIEGRRSPVRIICDTNLRIPEDCNICKTAKEYRTIVACGIEELNCGNAEEKLSKITRLSDMGIRVINAPDGKGKVDLKKLMQVLGEEEKIDSILLEGGGTLNASALEAGIVNEVKAFMAPKLFGGSESKSPVEGLGVSSPKDAYMLEFKSAESIGSDLLINYAVKQTED